METRKQLSSPEETRIDISETPSAPDIVDRDIERVREATPTSEHRPLPLDIGRQALALAHSRPVERVLQHIRPQRARRRLPSGR